MLAAFYIIWSDFQFEPWLETHCFTRFAAFCSWLDEKPLEVVKAQFFKLNSEHIQFVLDSLRDNTTRIRNMRQ